MLNEMGSEIFINTEKMPSFMLQGTDGFEALTILDGIAGILEYFTRIYGRETLTELWNWFQVGVEQQVKIVSTGKKLQHESANWAYALQILENLHLLVSQVLDAEKTCIDYLDAVAFDKDTGEPPLLLQQLRELFRFFVRTHTEHMVQVMWIRLQNKVAWCIQYSQDPMQLDVTSRQKYQWVLTESLTRIDWYVNRRLDDYALKIKVSQSDEMPVSPKPDMEPKSPEQDLNIISDQEIDKVFYLALNPQLIIPRMAKPKRRNVQFERIQLAFKKSKNRRVFLHELEESFSNTKKPRVQATSAIAKLNKRLRAIGSQYEIHSEKIVVYILRRHPS